jgi:hypothetical protein
MNGLRALLARIKHFEFCAGTVVEMLTGRYPIHRYAGSSTAFDFGLTPLRMTRGEEEHRQAVCSSDP